MTIAEVPEPEVIEECYAPQHEFGTRRVYYWPNGFRVEMLACPNGVPARPSELLTVKRDYIKRYETTPESNPT